MAVTDAPEVSGGAFPYRPTPAAREVLDRASIKFGFSARAYHRVLKVARTIADLAGVARIDTAHVSEAMALRALDRGSSG